LNIAKCSQLGIIDPGRRRVGDSFHNAKCLSVDAQQLSFGLATQEVSISAVDPGPNLVLLWFACLRQLPSAKAVLLHVESEVGLLSVGTVVLDEEGGRFSAILIPF